MKQTGRHFFIMSLLFVLLTNALVAIAPPVQDQSELKFLMSDFLAKFLNQFESTDFKDLVKLGDRSTFSSYLNASDMNVELAPNFDKQGKYFPGEALVLGRVGLRNDLMKVNAIGTAATKTLWHEMIHRIIRRKGGGAPCLEEEAYTYLCEHRESWLQQVKNFEINYKKGIYSAAKMQEVWDYHEANWKNYVKGDASNLSGPYSNRDPDDTCGAGGGTRIEISSAFIQQWDSVIGIQIDLNTLRDFFKPKIRYLEKTEEVERSLVACDYAKAARLLEEIANTDPKDDFMVKWEADKMPMLKRRAQAFVNARSALQTAKAAEGRNDFDGAISELQKALYAPDFPECLRKEVTEMKTRLERRKRSAAPCTTDSLNESLGSVIPSLPFFGQSDVARSGKPLTSPLKMSYSVEDANGAVAFNGPAKILFSASWSIGCAASGQAEANGYGRTACDGYQVYRAKGTIAAGTLGENSCVASAGIAGAQDINFSGDPYMGGAKAVVVTAGTSISVDVGIAIHAGAAHGARTKPEVIAAVKKAAEDWAKVVASRLMGSTNIPRGVSPPIIVSMLPEIVRQPDGGNSGAVQGYFAQAKSYLQQRNLDGAQAQFEQAYQVAPNSAALNYNLSWVYQAQDKPLTALKHAENYLRLAPLSSDRPDIESRIADMQKELQANPRIVMDSSGCHDVLAWAQTEQDVAKRGRDVARRQAVLEVLIAAQRGECENARKLQVSYKQRFGNAQ